MDDVIVAVLTQKGWTQAEIGILDRWISAPRASLGLQYTPLSAALGAIRHLQAHPRDAQGARRILHDAVCAGFGDHCDGDDHARRTQTDLVRALRKVLSDA